MGTIVSYTSFDHQAVSIVPVIASFDTEGHIVPLYIRAAGENYKVDTFWVNQKYGNITEYKCKIIDHGYLKPLLLTYYHSEGVWTIPK